MHRRRHHHWSGWCAIIGSVALALFWGIFSLDEPLFSIGFVMHNIPSMVVLIGGALGWRWPWIGAAWLAAAAAMSLLLFRHAPSLQYLPLVTLPPAVLAGLFALDALKNPRGM